MKITQATFPANDHIAFIQLSRPDELFQDCWAESDERVIIVGYRDDEQQKLRSAVARVSENSSYVIEGCLGTSVRGKIKAIVSSNPAILRELLGDLESRGLINKKEKDRAVLDLGVRTQLLHPLLSSEFHGLGAGI